MNKSRLRILYVTICNYIPLVVESYAILTILIVEPYILRQSNNKNLKGLNK